MMAKYDVLANFCDKEDKVVPSGKNNYYVGGKYPRDGYSPSAERIKYLQGSGNKLKKPVISGSAVEAVAELPVPAQKEKK